MYALRQFLAIALALGIGHADDVVAVKDDGFDDPQADQLACLLKQRERELAVLGHGHGVAIGDEGLGARLGILFEDPDRILDPITHSPLLCGSAEKNRRPSAAVAFARASPGSSVAPLCIIPKKLSSPSHNRR